MDNEESLSNAEWSQVTPFDIDDGQLDGLRPIDIFVLGVEWQMVFQQLESGEEFSRPIHPENKERILRLCIRKKRKVTFTNQTDEWIWMKVK